MPSPANDYFSTSMGSFSWSWHPQASPYLKWWWCCLFAGVPLPYNFWDNMRGCSTNLKKSQSPLGLQLPGCWKTMDCRGMRMSLRTSIIEESPGTDPRILLQPCPIIRIFVRVREDKNVTRRPLFTVLSIIGPLFQNRRPHQINVKQRIGVFIKLTSDIWIRYDLELQCFVTFLRSGVVNGMLPLT